MFDKCELVKTVLVIFVCKIIVVVIIASPHN